MSEPTTKTNGHTNGNGAAARNGSTNGHGLKRKDLQPIDWEIPRKTLHSSIGFFTIYLYTSGGSPKTVVYVLCTALAVIVPVDLLRLRSPSFERLYERCVGFLMRESEKKTMNGVVWYLVGVSAALALYPADVATVAILILSWADTAASTVGRMYSRMHQRSGTQARRLPTKVPFLPFLKFAPRKSLAGFVAATISGAVIAVGFWGWVAGSRPGDLSWDFDEGVLIGNTVGKVVEVGVKTGGWIGLGIIGVVAGLVSGVAEALDLGSLDDNLTLPVIAGGCLYLGLKLAALFSA